MRNSFGVKLGISIILLTVGLTTISLYYFYSITANLVQRQIAGRIKDIGSNSTFLFSHLDRQNIVKLKQAIDQHSEFSLAAVQKLPLGGTLNSLTPAQIQEYQSTPEFKSIVQILRKIHYASLNHITPLKDFYPQKFAAYPDAVLPYILITTPESPDRKFLKFLASFAPDPEGSDWPGNPIGNLYVPNSPIFDQAFQGEMHVAKDYYTDSFYRSITAAIPIKDEQGETIALLCLDYLAGSGHDEIRNLKYISLSIILISLILSILLSILLARYLGYPIQQLQIAAQKVQAQNYDVSIDIKRKDELGVLAEVFNLMVADVRSYAERLEQKVAQRTQELAIAKEKAEVANHAKSTFIANMSHELRSPLNAIIGFAQVILRTQNLPQEEYENARIIQNSGEYLLTLINDILDFSKIEAGKTTLNFKDFDLHHLLDDLEDMLSLRSSHANLELILHRNTDLPRYIHTDEVKLRQVLLNLSSNAIKFTQQGQVVISVNSRFDPETDHYILNFQVCDTGIGISQTELSQLFIAFSQTSSGKESLEGTGLGLVISQQFVQLLGGNITVESELGEGACFQFSIPVKLAKTQVNYSAIQQKEVLGLVPNQPQYRILTVDDKAINRQLLVKLLSPLGFGLKEANNGEEAIALWESWQPHLIFMDMRMPVIDGYEATKYIKSHVKGSATAIIALTASVLEEERAMVLSAGCDDFMRKPFQVNTIFDILHKHLGVKYIYAENLEIDDNSLTEIPLTTDLLEEIPSAWLNQLFQVTLAGDDKEALIVIAEIAETHSDLANILTKLVRQYQFEPIIDLIEPLINDQ